MIPANDPSAPLHPSPDGSRPGLIILADSQTSYRLHFHRRIVREIPELTLYSLFTLGHSNAPWARQSGVDINAIDFGANERYPKGSKIKLARFVIREWFKGGEMIRWTRKTQAAAVVVNGWSSLARLRVLRDCARRGVPVMVWGDFNIRSDEATGLKRKLKSILLHRICKWAGIILPCGSLGEAFIRTYVANPPPMIYVPYEPDYQAIQQISAAQTTEALARQKLSPDRRRLVYCGRLMSFKRVDLLIDAFIAIAPQRPEWDLLIVGDGPLRADLGARVPAELASRVAWTGFIDNSAEIGALLRGSDVMVQPSDNEPWAVSVNEGAAAGLALVASHVVGAAAELIKDGFNGRIFPAGDLKALTQCLLDVTDPSKIESMKQASAVQLADWRRKADPVFNLRKAMRQLGVKLPKGPTEPSDS